MSDKQDTGQAAGEGVVPATPPAGFELMRKGLGFIDALAPLYRKDSTEESVFGIVVAAQHANSMGICHGGVLMTLADIVAATGVNLARGEKAGSPTINLSMDFIAAAKEGEWLEGIAQTVNLRRRFGFCSGELRTPRRTVATFSGTFYFPDHEGLWESVARRSLFDGDDNHA
jgi:uncharacterized protein (TIGR00369 family)